MLFDTRTARYLAKAVEMVTTPQPPEIMEQLRPYLTNRCTECNEIIDIFDGDGGHAVVTDGQDGTGAYVVIGCEGYWLINPNLVGFRNLQWQDWTKGESFTVITDDEVIPGVGGHTIFLTKDQIERRMSNDDELHRRTCRVAKCPRCFPWMG